MSKMERVSQKPSAAFFEPAPRSTGIPSSKRRSSNVSFPRSCVASSNAHGFVYEKFQKSSAPILDLFSGNGCSKVFIIVCTVVMVCQYWKIKSQTWRMEVQAQDVEVKSNILNEEKKQLRQTRQYLMMEKHRHEKELSYLMMEKHQHDKELSDLRRAQQDLSKDRKKTEKTAQGALANQEEMERKLAEAVENARQMQVRFKAAKARSVELQREADEMALEMLRQREFSKKGKAEKDQISRENSKKQTLIESIQKQMVDAKLAEDELRAKVQSSEILVHESNVTLKALNAELNRERAREKQLLSKMINDTSEIKHLRKQVATRGHKLKDEEDAASRYRERAKQEQARALALEALRDNDQQTIEKLNAQLKQQVSDSDLAARDLAEERTRQSRKDAELIRHLQQTVRTQGAEVRELRVKVQKQKLSEKDGVLSDESPAPQQDDDVLEDSLEPISHHAGNYSGVDLD